MENISYTSTSNFNLSILFYLIQPITNGFFCARCKASRHATGLVFFLQKLYNKMYCVKPLVFVVLLHI